MINLLLNFQKGSVVFQIVSMRDIGLRIYIDIKYISKTLAHTAEIRIFESPIVIKVRIVFFQLETEIQAFP